MGHCLGRLRFCYSFSRSSILEWVAELTDRPLVLRRVTWYGRLTDSEAVRHEPRAHRRRLMDTDRTAPAQTAAAQPPTRRSETDSRQDSADRDSLCAPQRDPVEDVAAGDGLWLRQHVLASPREGATRGRLEAASSRAADRTAPPRPARSGPRGRRQRVAPRAARGEKTGPNPTDRRKAGSKHHVLTDAHGIPVVARLTSANQLAKRRQPHGSGLGRTRWVVERTLAWLHRFRRRGK